MPAKKFGIIERETPEWEVAWGGLIDQGFSKDRVDYNDGEGWQYMGSVRTGKRWFHEFRHRYHPRTSARMYARIAASADWRP